MWHLGTTTLKTPRLILRRFTKADAAAMYRNWASDPAVTRFLTWPAHTDVAVSKQVLADWVAGYENPRQYQWAIVPHALRESIGSISVVKIDDTIDEIQMGYCIGQDWRRQGYTSEALEAVIRFAFTELGANRVVAIHNVQNPHSGGVMLKCGMQKEGVIRQGYRDNQGLGDYCLHAILPLRLGKPTELIRG